jgi:hypothetical protein
VQMLKEKLNDGKIKRNLIQIEKDMIHDFYTNTKNEMKQIDSEVTNFESSMEELEQAQSTEIRVYMQKVKHLEYDHKNSLSKVELESKTVMKDENEFHQNNEKEARKGKADLKQQYGETDSSNIEEVNKTEDNLKTELEEIHLSLDAQKQGLIQNYNMKFERLKEELELRLKVEVHEIEERKN